ncbi:outer membrane protein TolC [Mesonia maritima]|uniref:Outer membrane protein TolC n=1 Tax=Mesonia maritima TaxID=1793873 RepID=A0ABU1K6Q5_9FLAO|nr:outer membrane protein TolC [Mesonia maritima]
MIEKPYSKEISLENHPEISLLKSDLETAEAKYKVAKADLLPKFNLQYGFQQISGNNGYYSYQAGISIPLFSGNEKQIKKSSAIAIERSENELAFRKKALKAEYASAYQKFEKWQKSYQFYIEEALPLAEEQKKGALLAYREGSIDFRDFTELLKETLETELNAINAHQNYLNALFELAYYQL